MLCWCLKPTPRAKSGFGDQPMISNDTIADTLEQLADLLEFQGANPFRLRAYRNGARKIRELPEAIAELVEQDTD
ncbi:MAG: hypothetical protein ACK53V_00025, partial [Planctomycetota bacterium]